MASMAQFVLRVRGPTAMWQLKTLNPSSTISDVKKAIENEHGVPQKEQALHQDRACKDSPLSSKKTLKALKLRHGSILYIQFDTSKVVVLEQSTKRVISEDGSLVAAKSEDIADRNAVRPGLMSLRSRKLHWTMDELMQIEAGYTFKIKRQPNAICQGVSLDRDMCNSFQQYVRQIGFSKTRRCAWLYGRYVQKLDQSKVDEDNKLGTATDSFGRTLKVIVSNAREGTTTQVQVDCSYEPPQRCTMDTMELLEDPNEELVASVASSLGLERVGFMYSHPGGRGEQYHFSANEIIMCAENQLLAGDEDMSSPFVTVKVTLNANNETDFQAYQMSKQCLELCAEGALLYDPNEPRGCLIHDTFSCLVEMKEVSRVDNDYFLANVPIMDHTAKYLTGKKFEHPHRFGGHEWNIQALGPYMKRTKKMPMLKRVSDFNVLLLSAKVLDPQSMKAICGCVQRQEELEEGYAMILESLGM